MTRREKHLKTTENKEEIQAITEISISDPQPKALSMRKIELSNTQKRPVSVRKKTNRAIKANSVALKASRIKSTKVAGGIGDSVREPSNDRLASAGNAGVSDGNSNKRRGSFITKSSFSYILILILILFCVVPMIEISYQVPVPYLDIETYTEQEPYVDMVYYSEKQPYTTTQAYVVSQPYTVTVPYVVYPQPAPYLPTTNNITPPHPPFPPQPQVYYRNVTKYMDVTQYKDVIQYQDIQKARNETKVKPVQKQRTVTKIGMETRYKVVPILYYLISYEE
jgi:hypothetical protein